MAGTDGQGKLIVQILRKISFQTVSYSLVDF